MSLIKVKRCTVCKKKLVQNTTTLEWECKNEKCPLYVEDEETTDSSTDTSATGN